LVWFLMTDPVKLLAYKVLDKIKAEDKPEANLQPDVKPDNAKSMPEPEADATNAQRNTQINDNGPQADAKLDAESDRAKRQPDAIAPVPPVPDATATTAAAATAAVTPPVKPSPPRPAGMPQSEPTPQLVTRVHKLYEELGRLDVMEVEAWERAHGSPQHDEPAK
jgi:H+-transporting ATPase